MSHPEDDGDVRVLSTGHFKLDRGRAMDKLAHFQLADHRQYVAELVAAAVCAGASEISVRIDADDFEIEWDGAHPDLADLDGFFDALFYRGDDPLQRMVQHLAQGVLGAAGIEPRWVRLHRPGLTLDLTDPAAPVSTDNDRTAGVRVEVRKRFSMGVVLAWGVKAFARPEQVDWLTTRAVGCPVPVVVNGGPLDLSITRALGHPLSHIVAVRDPHGRFHGSVGRKPNGESRFLVVRDGVLAQVRTLGPPKLRFGGWVVCDGLELDASRLRVTEDDLWTEVHEAFLAALRESLAHYLYHEQYTLEELRLARELLAGPDCPLAAVPLFISLDHSRNWSLHELARAPRVLVTGHSELNDPGLDLPQLDGTTRLVHKLDQWLPDRVTLGTRELKDREAGRRQRAYLQAHVVPLEVDAVYSRTFEEEGDRYCVGLGIAGADWKSARLELRVDGLTVVTRKVDHPHRGTALVRIESDRLEPATDWASVGPASEVQRLTERALALLARCVPEAIREHPHHPQVRSLAHAWLHAATGGRTRYDKLPVQLRKLPLFTTGHGAPLSIDDVVQACTRRDRLDSRKRPVVWVVPATEPAPPEAEGVLHVDEDELRLLKRVFGGRVEQVGRRLAARRVAKQVRAEAKRAGRIPHVALLGLGLVPVTESIDLPDFGIQGVIGLRDTKDGTNPCVVLREGVVLGTLDLPADLPGAVAVVEWSGAEPTDDWRGLSDPETAALVLAERLEPCFVELARTTALEDERLHLHPPSWWVAFLSRGPRVAGELSTAPFIRTAGGRVRTLAELIQHKAKGKSAGKVRWVPPGMGVPQEVGHDYLYATADQVRILEAWLGKRWVTPGKEAVQTLIRQRERFFRAPVRPFSLPSEVVAVYRHHTPDLEVLIGLDGSSTATPGMVVDVRHGGIDLERLHRRDGLPWRVVVQGSRVRPQPSFKAIADPSITRHIFKVVKQARLDVLDRLAQITATDEHHRRVRRQVWLAIRRRSLRWLPADRRNHVRDALAHHPIVEDTAGGQHTIRGLREAVADGTLRVLSRAPGAVPMPQDQLWIVATGRDRDFLAELAGGTPASADRVVEELRQGAERRAELRPEPLIPRGRYPLDTAVDLPSGGRAWLGLTPGRPGVRVLRVAGRPVAEEPVPEAHGVRIVVEHDGVDANRTFDGWEGTALASRTRTETVDAIGPLLKKGLLVPARLGGPAAAVIDTALRFRASGGRVEVDAPVLPVTHGPPRTLDELARLARSGPIRFAPSGTTGRPLQDDNPVFTGDDHRRSALGTWGKVVDATAELAREDRVWRRRQAPPFSAKKPARALFEVPVPSPFTGTLWATTDPDARVTTLLDGRQLEARPSAGPVPMAGTLTHPDLEADRWFERAKPDHVRAKLAGAVLQASENALETLLDSTWTSKLPAELYIRCAVRTFAGKAAIASATGTRKKLAELPVFPVGHDGLESLAHIAKRPRTVRWVGGVGHHASLDPDRPLVTVPSDLVKAYSTLLGGEDASEQAAAEHAAAVRVLFHALPFELPDEDWLTTADGHHKGARYKLGLLEDCARPGTIDLRVRGLPLGSLDGLQTGVHAVVELDPKSTDPTHVPTSLPKSLRRPLQAAARQLVAKAGPELLDGHHRARRFSRLVGPALHSVRPGKLPPKSHPARPWLDARVVATSKGPRSVAELAGLLAANKPLIWGGPTDAPPPGGLVLVDHSGNRTLAEALGWLGRVWTPAQWQQALAMQQAVEAERKRQAARVERQAATRDALQAELSALVPDKSTMRATVASALDRVDALPEEVLAQPSLRTVHAWAALDGVLTEAGDPEAVVDAALHLARRLVELGALQR